MRSLMQMTTLGISAPWAEAGGGGGAVVGAGTAAAAAGPANGRGQMMAVAVAVVVQQAVAAVTEASRVEEGGRQAGARGRTSDDASVGKCCQHGACNSVVKV